VAVAESVAVSMGGCIASALTGSRRWRWWVRSWGLSPVEQDELWARWRRGESLRLIARRMGKRGPSIRAFVLQTGGVQQRPPQRAARSLTAVEREEISRGVAAGDSCRAIARRLGRAAVRAVGWAGRGQPGTRLLRRRLRHRHHPAHPQPGGAAGPARGRPHQGPPPDPAGVGRLCAELRHPRASSGSRITAFSGSSPAWTTRCWSATWCSSD
jgi:hypothetical protein